MDWENRLMDWQNFYGKALDRKLVNKVEKDFTLVFSSEFCGITNRN